VDDVKNAGLDRATGTEIYVPYGKRRVPAIAARTPFSAPKVTPVCFSGAVRQEMNSIDPRYRFLRFA